MSNAARHTTPGGRASPLPEGWDLDVIVEQLRDAGVTISLDRHMRAHAVLAQFQEFGARLHPDEAQNWLASLLCSAREETAILNSLLHPNRADTKSKAVQLGKVVRLASRAQVIRFVVIALGLVIVLGGLLASLGNLSDITPDTPLEPVVVQPSENPLVDETERVIIVKDRADLPPERVLRFALSSILQPLYLMLPFLFAAWLVVTGKRAQKAALTRKTALGKEFQQMKIPRRALAPARKPRLRWAMERFKAPRREPGKRLDVDSTVSAAVNRPGLFDIRYLDERRNTEYLILAEGRSVNAHRRLVIRRIQQRLHANDTSYAQYDLGAAVEQAVFDSGKRDGPPQEGVSQILKRYAGGRLILFGTAQEILARQRRATFATSIARMVEDYQIVMAFIPVPKGRWGRSEAVLKDMGVALFEASDAGVIDAGQAIDAFSNDGQMPPTRIAQNRDDRFLSSLRVNNARYLSDIAPDPRETEDLVRQVLGYLGTTDGITLFAALAAVPSFDNDMVLYLSDEILGHPLDDDMAMRLSGLPWMDTHRLPDWLRLAVLRQIPQRTKVRLREQLALMYAGLMDQRDEEMSDSTINILNTLNFVDTIKDRLGMGAGVVAGEAVFLRFLDDDLTDDLDQDIGQIDTHIDNTRLIIAFGIVAFGAFLQGTFVRALEARTEFFADTLDALISPLPLLVLLLQLLAVAALRSGVPMVRRYKWALWPSAVAVYIVALSTVFLVQLYIGSTENTDLEIDKFPWPPILVLITLPAVFLTCHLLWDQSAKLTIRTPRQTNRHGRSQIAIFVGLMSVLMCVGGGFEMMTNENGFTPTNEYLVITSLIFGTIFAGAIATVFTAPKHGTHPKAAVAQRNMTQHCGVFVGQVAVASSVILTTLALTLVALDVIPVLKTPNLVDGLSAIILALILGLAVLSRAGLWRLASIHAVMLFSTSFITDIWIDAVAAIFESPTFEVITLIITALGLFAASLFIDSRIAAPVDRFIGRLFPQYQREAS